MGFELHLIGLDSVVLGWDEILDIRVALCLMSILVQPVWIATLDNWSVKVFDIFFFSMIMKWYFCSFSILNFFSLWNMTGFVTSTIDFEFTYMIYYQIWAKFLHFYFNVISDHFGGFFSKQKSKELNVVTIIIRSNTNH